MLSYGASKVVLADFNRENLSAKRRDREGLSGKDARRSIATYQGNRRPGDDRQAAAFGGERIDLLFNNAGAGFGGEFDKESNEDWAKAFALNFYGALYGVRAVLPIMRKQGGGHIVNTISGIAFVADAFPDDVQRHEGGAERAFARPPLRIVGREHPGTSATRHDRHRDFSQDRPPPAYAQTAKQSASAILAGVARMSGSSSATSKTFPQRSIVLTRMRPPSSTTIHRRRSKGRKGETAF